MSMSIFWASCLIFAVNWSGSAPLENWKLIHFRGPAVIQAEPGEDGVVLSADRAGYTLDSFYTKIANPGADRVVLRFEAAAHAEKLPLLVCLTGGPGCVNPAIKKRVTLDPAQGLTQVELEYMIQNFPDHFTIEFLLEGSVPAGKLMTISGVMMEAKHLDLEARMTPRSGVVFTDSDNQVVSLAWQAATPTHAPRFQLSDNAGKVLLEKSAPQATSGTEEFDLSSLPAGEFLLTAQSRSGETELRFTIIRTASRRDSITIINGTPYRNGKPYFAIGIFHAGDAVIDIVNATNRELGLAEVNRKQLFADLEKRHFNAVHNSWAVASPDYFADARTYNMTVLSESRWSGPAGAAQVNAEPNILGFYSWDEPVDSQFEDCANLYKNYKKVIPHHPVMIAFNSLPVGGTDRPMEDIAILDPYPIRNKTSDVGSIIAYTAGANQYLNWNDPGTCAYSSNQLFCSDHPAFSTKPTPAQVRAEVYAALVAGAKGIFYYAYYTHELLSKGMPDNPKRKYWFLPESDLWNAIGPINAEIESFADFALIGNDAPEFKLKGVTASRSWQLGDEVLLIAVNTSGAGEKSGTLQYPAGWSVEPAQASGSAVVLAPYECRSWRFRR